MIISPPPTSRYHEDTLRKSGEYLQAGMGQDWVVDPESTRLTVLGGNGRGWDVLLELDTDRLTGSVAVGTHGTVAVDLWPLLAP